METNTYTLIILDVLLSQHGGADILSAVRQLNDAPILALSEQASSGERVMALQQLLQEYDIQSAEDIQDALKDLLGGTIKEMMETLMNSLTDYIRMYRKIQRN